MTATHDQADGSQTTVSDVTTTKDDQLLMLKYCDNEMAWRKSAKQDASRRAERVLILVSVLTTAFIVAELVGGYIAHSLAIMTDAFHMISDLTSFLISILAIHLARKQPTARYSFGFQRAEVVGALASIMIIWVLTFILVYMAIVRIINADYDVDADTMMVTAGVGVAFNIVIGLLLHFGKAGHSHF
ncbi:cation diffusion facilitator family transporter containing protein, partial [Aphelenchoides avenae]